MLAHDMSPEVLGNDSVVRVVGLGLAGRYDEARPLLLATRDAATVDAFRAYAQTLLDWLDRNGSALVETAAQLASLKIMEDPEAQFQIGWMLCDVGEHARGLELLKSAVDKDYAAVTALAHARAFDAVRSDAAFQRILAKAQRDLELGLAVFRQNGGERLLGR
jgi:hypothetical protein